MSPIRVFLGLFFWRCGQRPASQHGAGIWLQAIDFSFIAHVYSVWHSHKRAADICGSGIIDHIYRVAAAPFLLQFQAGESVSDAGEFPHPQLPPGINATGADGLHPEDGQPPAGDLGAGAVMMARQDIDIGGAAEPDRRKGRFD